MRKKTAGRAVDNAAASAKNGIRYTAAAARSGFYDSKAGILLLTALALVLWWIPYIGQMIPGYVGGRRAGSMSRGVLTAVTGTLLILALTLGGSLALDWLMSTRTMVDSMASYPALESFFNSATQYLDDFVVVSETGFSLNGDYVLMGVFAVIGGAMANQARKETALIVGAAVAEAAPKPPRSVRAAAAGRSLRFESYSDLAAISVNSMAGSEARRETKTAAETEVRIPITDTKPPAEAEVRVTSTSVSAAESIPMGSCATSSETAAEHAVEPEVRPKHRKDKPDHTPFSDYEYL